ncbi:MAG: glutamate synthase subunit alpha, partial [Janthinobacterium lividum]
MTLLSSPSPAASSFRRPTAQGLYDPALDHDACGVAFVATLTGIPSHAIVDQGLEALRNLDHRGATGADARTGDGAGILLQVPDRFLRAEAGFELPAAGSYAVGNAFLPVDPTARAEAKATIERIAGEEGLTVLGWRVVATESSSLSDLTRGNMPSFEQLFVTASGQPVLGLA